MASERDVSRDVNSIADDLRALLRLVAPDGKPNLHDLNMLTRNLLGLQLNLKFNGYHMAKALADALPLRAGQLETVGITSKPSTQADLESSWAAHWCAELGIRLIFHRKIWEYAFVLQALYEHDMLVSGRRGLGFGCGEEPIPSYLASKDICVTVTDQPIESAKETGWIDSQQHASSIHMTHYEYLVSKDQFDRNVDHRFVDMNSIPQDLTNYDFCWSICSLEHLGSIRQGIEFIERSIETLRPGGIAVHTTEFSFFVEDQTLDNWPTVLFQRKHFQEIGERLRACGHWVAPLNFDVGARPMDQFIDLPPYVYDFPPGVRDAWSGDAPHLKLIIDGFPSTCFGLIVRKGES